MKTKQAAEREEQQRIKSLVLNYDLRDGDDQQDGDSILPILPNFNIHTCNAGLEKTAASHSRSDKPARSGQRARKLQLSDVTDWYEPKSKTQISHVQKPSPFAEQLIPKRKPLSPVPRSPATSPPKKGKAPTPKTNGRGRLSRREIEQEHATRIAAQAENRR
jgi:regulator of nonsense transcripts 2